MKLSKAQAAALATVDAGGHISYDRLTGKWRAVAKNGTATFLTQRALQLLLGEGLLRETDRRYETGTHALTDAGRTALRETT